MPRKIRQLKADLQRAGFVLRRGMGKGSHTAWEHPETKVRITLSGHDGDDARQYQERDVKEAIHQATSQMRRDSR